MISLCTRLQACVERRTKEGQRGQDDQGDRACSKRYPAREVYRSLVYFKAIFRSVPMSPGGGVRGPENGRATTPRDPSQGRDPE